MCIRDRYKGRLVPTRGKECSSDQMPFIDQKFPTYKEFANASLEDILGEEEVDNALKREVNIFESIVLINNGDGSFSKQSLPLEAQVAPLLSSIVKDLNDDGAADLVIGGNMFGAEVETPRYDAGDGLVLLGEGDGAFRPQLVVKTGFYAPKNVKSIANLETSKGENLFLIGNNNAPLQLFRFNKNKDLGLN